MKYLNARWDKNDPENPTDMLGRPIAEGDYVAWPISIGRSVGMSVGEVVKINFKHPNPAYPYKGSALVNGPQQGAEKYTLLLQPLITTGYYTIDREYVPQGFYDEDGKLRHFRDTGMGVKPITLQHVGKVLRMDPSDVHEAVRHAEPSV